ncbi:MAG: tRNA preQ1(34) S-adenosylmethionine ribosyltransferase-isomerase QueA [Thermoguttaceae bacterium]|nr:tRNA preQ1(34) S-adenosylmethionine ribosyltransferase-isomerase QueA [Thermoguttaceae bacterium]
MSITSDDVSYYDYDLPKELIAQQPLADRDAAKMMVVNRQTGAIEHRQVGDFIDLLTPADVVVLNNTKVVPARLIGVRVQTGGHWEGLFLELAIESCELRVASCEAARRRSQSALPRACPKPLPLVAVPNSEFLIPNSELNNSSFGSQSVPRWRLIGSTRGKLQLGERVQLLDVNGRPDVVLRFETKAPDASWTVVPESDENYLTILDRVGRVPIPPYIRNGQMEESDRNNYQTVFAQVPGAVAAPTAGLHFSEETLNKIRQKGVDIEYVTLHVGIGTFKPISVTKLSEHEMHCEYAQIDAATAEKLNQRRYAGGRLFAIGTTSVRTLESAGQSGVILPMAKQTNLFIKQPYNFKAVDAILTNFHLPKSTLLVMIRAFGGDELIKEAYRQAIENKYRFYSYGDCMVIL